MDFDAIIFTFQQESKESRLLGRIELKKILLLKRLNPIHIKQITLFDTNWVDILN